MKRQFARLTALIVVALLVVPAVRAPAATGGLAWDSVTKMAMGSDASALQPGSFEDDYATASAAQPPAQSGGGLFGHFKAAIGMGQAFQQMMTDGFAERHYVAGSKERTDNVVTQTATITDCVARTITTLNLRDKTYKVESMDQPSAASSGGSGGGGNGGSFKDNGERIAIVVSNTALGLLDVGGESSHGFRSDMTFTETNASGESHSQNANVVGYYSGLAMPAPQCARFGAWTGSMPGPGAGVAALAAATRAMRALQFAGVDKRFSMKQNGPPLPIGRMSMWEAMTFAAGSRGGMTFVTERGHVRPITAVDPIFGIPAGFTQER